MMKRRHLCTSALLGLLPHAAQAAQAAHADRLRLPSGEVELVLDSPLPADTRHEVDVWVTRSVAALVGYFGRQPQPRIELRLQATDGAGVGGGLTDRDPGPFVRVRIGQRTGAAAFREDWVLVHELVHLSVPRLPRAHSWLHEGLATYVETVSRSRAGITPATQLWGELARGMPNGLPDTGDRGLDHTRSWGRTYWGGAIFCLIADVRLLRASAGRAGLQQALQGVQAAGGHYGQDWSAAQFLSTADAAVGQTVLTDLYRDMKDAPMPVDLEGLWRELGVSTAAGGVQLLDAAPGAAIRRAIEAGPAHR